jgi:hypothetical protein
MLLRRIYVDSNNSTFLGFPPKAPDIFARLLPNLEFLDILPLEVPNIKFRGNLFSKGRTDTCGRTWRHYLEPFATMRKRLRTQNPKSHCKPGIFRCNTEPALHRVHLQANALSRVTQLPRSELCLATVTLTQDGHDITSAEAPTRSCTTSSLNAVYYLVHHLHWLHRRIRHF